MKLLIIEDDEYKAKWIKQEVEGHFPDLEILESRSVNSGLLNATELRPDVVLLDMSLTTFDVGPNEAGGRPQNFGGLEVLRQFERLDIRMPTIVITQYNRFQEGNDEMTINALSKKLAEDFPNMVIDVIYYNSAQGRWRVELIKVLRKLLRKETSRA